MSRTQGVHVVLGVRKLRAGQALLETPTLPVTGLRNLGAPEAATAVYRARPKALEKIQGS